MKLLIFQTEFTAFSSQLQSITSGHQSVPVNVTNCVYCDIDDLNAFDTLKPQLNKNKFATGDGILLPEEAL